VGKSTLVRSPKFYGRDSGLAHALLAIGTSAQLLGHPVVGGSWEGVVTEALIDAAGPDLQFSCYCTAAGAELDLVIEQRGRTAFAIMIKRSIALKIERGFYWGANDSSAARTIFVAPRGNRYPARDGVDVMSLHTAPKEVAAGR
jgi:uncharacterized protein